MGLIRKKHKHHKNNNVNTHVYPIDSGNKKELCRIKFEEYTGQTVTVFVNAGGDSGKGFTGVLMSASDTYLRLLIIPGQPPACAHGSSCDSRQRSELFCALCPFNRNGAMGSIAVIPVCGIAAFVHNAVHN